MPCPALHAFAVLVGLGWRAAGRAGLEEGGGAWLCFIRETAKSSKFCQPANFASRFLGKICCLFVDILKSRSSQYQQVLPTDSWVKFAAIDLFVATYILNRLRRTRTTGIRSTGLICKGPKTLFMFVFGKLCLYLFCFVFFCLYLSFFVFICLYLSLFVFVCLLFVTASCCSTWDLASSSTSTIHRRGLSPPWCEFVF